MRKGIMMGLVLLNVLLAVALFAAPARSWVSSFTLSDCCQGEGAKAYCCRQCCLLTENCDYDSDCRPGR
ncbi:MAG: hypothetical protein OXE96_11510 [Gemmatimonadetes bacterium]|nr:hypothetical protein [Gemmatimonadota bacterium]